MKTFKEEIIEILEKNCKMLHFPNEPEITPTTVADSTISILLKWAEGKKMKEGCPCGDCKWYRKGWNDFKNSLIDYLKASKEE